jgi:hypothetical protein
MIHDCKFWPLDCFHGNAPATPSARVCARVCLLAGRKQFALPKLPFYFVQLAPCYGHKDCGNFVNVRNAQMAGLLLAVSISMIYALSWLKCTYTF